MNIKKRKESIHNRRKKTKEDLGAEGKVVTIDITRNGMEERVLS
jgi:hypothetical protein